MLTLHCYLCHERFSCFNHNNNSFHIWLPSVQKSIGGHAQMQISTLYYILVLKQCFLSHFFILWCCLSEFVREMSPLNVLWNCFIIFCLHLNTHVIFLCTIFYFSSVARCNVPTVFGVCTNMFWTWYNGSAVIFLIVEVFSAILV